MPAKRHALILAKVIEYLRSRAERWWASCGVLLQHAISDGLDAGYPRVYHMTYITSTHEAGSHHGDIGVVDERNLTLEKGGSDDSGILPSGFAFGRRVLQPPANRVIWIYLVGNSWPTRPEQ